MAAADGARPIRRVVLAFDSSGQGTGAAEPAARLAARLGAEILGLFIADEDLERLIAMPHLVSASSLAPDRTGPADDLLSRAVRRQERAAREALERAADRARLARRFEVRRGRLAQQALDQPRAGDLTVFARVARLGAVAGGGAPALGPLVRTLLAGPPRAVLMLRPGTPRAPRDAGDGPVLLAYDGSAAAPAAFDVAVAVAAARRRALTVVLITPRLADGAAWRDALMARRETMGEMHGAGGGAGPAPAFAHQWRPDLTDLCRAAHRRRADCLVLPASLPGLETESAAVALERLDSSVLLVR